MKPAADLEREIQEIRWQGRKKRREYLEGVFQEILKSYPEVKLEGLELIYEEKASVPLELVLDMKINENKYDLKAKLMANEAWYSKHKPAEQIAMIARELETYLYIKKDTDKSRIDDMCEKQKKLDYYNSFIGEWVSMFGEKAKEAKALREWKDKEDQDIDLKVAQRGFGKGLLSIIQDKKRKKLVKKYLKENK